MCNAWNHPKDCNCGWGGVWHGNIASKLPISTKSYESYVIPNARCPVCGSEVFFYQSPDGGRVFFEELGPPWPKHPCTDKNQTTSYKKIETRDAHSRHEFLWKLAGWFPVQEIRKNSDNSQYYELMSESQHNNVVFLNIGQLSENETHSPIFVRKVSENEFDVSFLDKDSKSVKTKAYSSIENAKGKKLSRIIQPLSTQRETEFSKPLLVAIQKKEN